MQASSSPPPPTTTTTTTTLFMNNKKKGSKKKTRSSGGGGGGFGAGSSSASSTTSTTIKDSFPYAGAIRPGLQSPKRVVLSDDIMKPDYAQTGIPSAGKKKMMLPWMIEVKTADEIEKMKAAGQAAREVLDLAGKMARVPGTTTEEIDVAVHEAILDVCCFVLFVFMPFCMVALQLFGEFVVGCRLPECVTDSHSNSLTFSLL